MDRLDKSIDQIALTYEFKNAKPKAADVFDASFLPSAAERKAQLTAATPRGTDRDRLRRARWRQPRLRRAAAPARSRSRASRSHIERRRVRRRRRPVRLRQVHPDEARDRPAVPVQGHGAGRGRRSSSKPVKIAGMAFQAPTLLPWRTTLDNLLLPLEIVEPHRSRHPPPTRRIRRARRRRCWPRSASRGQGDKFPWELSGGMQQRTSLCRALIHEPQLLMLDEPFGALDAFTREELWCVIRDLHAARKITVILVTHDLREAVFLADRVFVMSARPGRIAGRARDRHSAPARPRSDLHAGSSPTSCTSCARTS